MKKLEVQFRVEFNATIEVEDNATNEDIMDAIEGIVIPENEQCQHIEGTFKTVHIPKG